MAEDSFPPDPSSRILVTILILWALSWWPIDLMWHVVPRTGGRGIQLGSDPWRGACGLPLRGSCPSSNAASAHTVILSLCKLNNVQFPTNSQAPHLALGQLMSLIEIDAEKETETNISWDCMTCQALGRWRWEGHRPASRGSLVLPDIQPVWGASLVAQW